MTRESDPNNTFIGDFQNTGGIVDLPETDGTILVSEVDDQIRDAKQMIFNTFKSCDGEVTSTHTELNYVDGAEQNLALWTKGQTASGLAIATGDSADPNTYTLTTGLTHTLADGDHFTFQVDEENIGASLLQVDSNTARNLVDSTGTNIDDGTIKNNSIIEVVYDLSATKFYVIAGLTVANCEQVPSGATTKQDLSGSGNFTATETADHTFRLLGGGGGGGPNSGAVGSGGGGGGGEYLEVVISLTVGQNVAYVVGNGGAGGANGGIDGADGFDTTITFSGTTYTANGGSGGKTTGNGRAGGAGGQGGGGSGGTPLPVTVKGGGKGGDGSVGGSDIGGGGGSGGGTSGTGNNGVDASVGGTGANGSGGALGGQSNQQDGADADAPTLGTFESGGGGAGSDGTFGFQGGLGGTYGSGGGGSNSTGNGGNGSTGIITVIW